MSPLAKELELNEQEKNLFKQLDQAIDEMESGQILELNESMAKVREQLKLRHIIQT